MIPLVLPGCPCHSDEAWPKATWAPRVTGGAGVEDCGGSVWELHESSRDRLSRISMRLPVGGKGSAPPSASKGVTLVSRFCCNKPLKTQWLKIHASVLSYKSGSQRVSWGPKSRCHRAVFLSGECRGESFLPSLFPSSRSCPYRLACGHIIQASVSIFPSPPTLTLLSPAYQDPRDYIGPAWIIPSCSCQLIGNRNSILNLKILICRVT